VAKKKCPDDLRRVVVWDEVNQRQIVLLTNHLEIGATTIAAIYRDRWQIELFFKTLKQHLKVKTFVGTSENARIQLWTALIALRRIKWLHYQSNRSWAFSNLAAMLRSRTTASFAARFWTASKCVERERVDLVLENSL
jgi:IS4 transposase